MLDQNSLLSALMHYHNHQYLSALNHFNACALQHPDQVSKMIVQSLEAITNMQLSNYTHAAEQLIDLRGKILHWQRNNQSKSRSADVELLQVKVLANLMIINLINCNPESEHLFEELLVLLSQRYERNPTAGKALFKSLLKSLFGFQSFAQLEDELEDILSRNEGKDAKRDKTLLESSVLLSSYSIYSHLIGKTKQAIKLQRKAYQISKQNNQIIPAVVSLRHLEELYVQTSNEKERKRCRQEMIVLMGSEQLEGIAEETLFRNYRIKIQNAQKIIVTLIERQNQFMNEETSYLSCQAVIYKLRSLQNAENKEKLEAVITLIKKDASLLDLMAQADFVKEAIDQFTQKCYRFKQAIERYQHRLYGQFWHKLLQGKNGNYRKQNKIININLQLEQESSFSQKATPKGKKHNFATTLYMPPKDTQTHRSQIPKRQDQNTSLNSSRLSIKPPSYPIKNNQKNQVYLQAQKQKAIYRIGKQDKKPSSKVQRGRETNPKQKTERSQRSWSKDIAVKQSNGLGQFMRNDQSHIPKRQKGKQENILVPEKEEKIQINSQIEEKSETKPVKIQQPKSIKIQKIQSSENKPQSYNSGNTNQSKQTISKSDSRLSPLKQSQTKLQLKLKKIITLCVQGQYIQKRHFSSDGGAERFFSIGHHKDKIFWGQDQEHHDQSSYALNDIKGIVYGKVTETMCKECNKKLQPWKCFSLILKKRTFDVYCSQDNDLKFWLPGLSIFLKDLTYNHSNYKVKGKQNEKRIRFNELEESEVRDEHRKIMLGDKTVSRFYSVGRVLWKRFLMRMEAQYLPAKKKDKKKQYGLGSAYAIVVCAVRRMNYKPNHIKRIIE